jgi:hypothetical protein
MNRRRMLEIAATIAFGVNLAAAYVIGFVWTPNVYAHSGYDFGPEQMYLFLHVALVFFSSFLFGTIIADITKTLIYTIVAAAIGAILATAIITAPAIIFTEYAMFVDATMTVALVTIVKFFIIGATFLVLGAIIGSFFGNSLANRIAQDAQFS